MRACPVLLLAAIALGASRPAASPVTCRYRVSYRGEVTRIQVAHHNVSRETIPVTGAGVVTLRLADTAGGRALELVVDSMTVTRSDGTALPDAGDPRAARWHGLLTADGRLTTVNSPPPNPMTRPLDRYLRFFFPPAARGSAGSGWVDTTTWATNQHGETGSDRMITAYGPVRRERREGKEVRVLGATWNGARTGTAPAGPEQMTISATSTGRSEYAYVDGDACPLAGWRAGSTTSTRMAPAFNAPLTTTSADSMAVTRIP